MSAKKRGKEKGKNKQKENGEGMERGSVTKTSREKRRVESRGRRQQIKGKPEGEEEERVREVGKRAKRERRKTRQIQRAERTTN